MVGGLREIMQWKWGKCRGYCIVKGCVGGPHSVRLGGACGGECAVCSPATFPQPLQLPPLPLTFGLSPGPNLAGPRDADAISGLGPQLELGWPQPKADCPEAGDRVRTTAEIRWVVGDRHQSRQVTGVQVQAQWWGKGQGGRWEGAGDGERKQVGQGQGTD